LRKAVFFVATNPVAYRKLQAEIDAVAVKANLSPSNAAPNYQLRAMPYLQAAIKEVLRLWPPVMGLTARMSHRDDVTSGVPLSTDTHVAWALWAITKNQDVFGADADVFVPELWLDPDRERVKKMADVQGLVFAGGSRWECLGKRLAYTELGKTMFEVSAASYP